MKFYTYSPVYDKNLPWSTKHVYNPSKYFRCTVDDKYVYDKSGKIIGKATNHVGLTWTVPSTGKKVKQIAYDFGTIRSAGKKSFCDRRSRIVFKGWEPKGGPYLVLETIGVPSGARYEHLIPHTVATAPLNKWLNPMVPFGRVATKAELPKGVIPHTHYAVAKNGVAISPKLVITG